MRTAKSKVWALFVHASSIPERTQRQMCKLGDSGESSEERICKRRDSLGNPGVGRSKRITTVVAQETSMGVGEQQCGAQNQ